MRKNSKRNASKLLSFLIATTSLLCGTIASDVEPPGINDLVQQFNL